MNHLTTRSLNPADPASDRALPDRESSSSAFPRGTGATSSIRRRSSFRRGAEARGIARVRPHVRVLGLVTALALPLALSACAAPASNGPGTSTAAAALAPTRPGTTHPVAPGRSLTFDSAWVKAGSGMTAAFGTITNPTDHDVTLVSGSTPAAQLVQLHMMQQQADGSMGMTEQKEGFVVPAHGARTLRPGGEHIMLLVLSAPLGNGEDVTLTMVSAGGERFEWTVPVRAFAGAGETYAPQSPHTPGMVPSTTAVAP